MHAARPSSLCSDAHSPTNPPKSCGVHTSTPISPSAPQSTCCSDSAFSSPSALTSSTVASTSTTNNTTAAASIQPETIIRNPPISGSVSPPVPSTSHACPTPQDIQSHSSTIANNNDNDDHDDNADADDDRNSSGSAGSEQHGRRMMAARGSHWSFLEKARFEAALHKHGAFAWNAIISAVGTRSEKQVKAYAARYRRRKKLAARIVSDAYRQSTQEPCSPSSSWSCPDGPSSTVLTTPNMTTVPIPSPTQGMQSKKKKKKEKDEDANTAMIARRTPNSNGCNSTPTAGSSESGLQFNSVGPDINIVNDELECNTSTRCLSAPFDQEAREQQDQQRSNDKDFRGDQGRAVLPVCYSKPVQTKSILNHRVSSLSSCVSNITVPKPVLSAHSLLPTSPASGSLPLRDPKFDCKLELGFDCHGSLHQIAQPVDEARIVTTDLSMTTSTSPPSLFAESSFSKASLQAPPPPLYAAMTNRICSSFQPEGVSASFMSGGAQDCTVKEESVAVANQRSNVSAFSCEGVELDIAAAVAIAPSNMDLDLVASPGGASSCMSAHVSEGVLDDDEVLLADDVNVAHHSSLPPSNLDEDGHVASGYADGPFLPAHYDSQALLLNHDDAAAVDTRFLQHNLYLSEPLGVFSDFASSL